MVKNPLARQETQVRSSEEGTGYPLQYSCLRNPMGRGGWQVILPRIAQGGDD